MNKITLQTIHNDLLRIEKLLKPEISGEIKSDSNWFVIIDDGKKKTSELLNDCRKLFPVWSYYSDEHLDKDFPPVETKFKYRKRVEADEELKNKSVDDLEKEGIKGITLRERIIMELQYFKETGKHLDIVNLTLCSGSLHSDGFAVYADWYGGKFKVDWNHRDHSDDKLRSRQQFPL